jgi:O-antigen/teichoic acid export membrane protein
MLALIRNYAFVLAGNGAAGILSFLVSVILSRVMPVEDFGVFSLFFTILTIVWLLPSFIDSSYVRYARADGPERAEAYLRVNLVFKVRAAVILVALSPLAGIALGRWILAGKIAPEVAALAVVGGAALAFLTSIIADFQVREKFARYSLGNISFYALVLVLLGALSVRGRVTPLTVAAVFVAAAASAGGAAFLILLRRIGRLAPLDRDAASRMLALGRWILATGLLFIVVQRIDMFFAGLFLPMADVGIYAAASRLLSTLTVFIGAASAILLPKAAAAVRSPGAAKAYWKNAWILVGIILAVLVLLAAFAPLIVSFFFGGKYAGAEKAVRVLFVSQLPQVIALPGVYFLYGLEDTFAVFAAMAACSAVNIAANIVLTPRIGIVGPGWAIGAGYAVYLAAIGFGLLRHRTRRPGAAGAPA